MDTNDLEKLNEQLDTDVEIREVLASHLISISSYKFIVINSYSENKR